MSADGPGGALRERIAKAIRQSLWAEWGEYVPDGDESLSSLGGTAQEGYLRSADAVIATLFAEPYVGPGGARLPCDGACDLPADVVAAIRAMTDHFANVLDVVNFRRAGDNVQSSGSDGPFCLTNRDKTQGQVEQVRAWLAEHEDASG